MRVVQAAVLSISTATLMFAQSATVTRFETASVKPVADASGIPGPVRVLPGGRLSAQKAILRSVIQSAFQIQQRFQLVGAPDWIESARYDIEAKAETDVPPQQLWLMLQSLLEDRFKLKAHRETRELPVYDLVAAKGGVKLPPPKDGGCLKPDPNGPGLPPPPAPPGQAPTPLCGTVMGAGSSSGMRLYGGNIKMPALIRTVTAMLGRAIIDTTNYSDPFDVNILFTFDQSLSGLTPPPGVSSPVQPETPSIFTVLQEQLGLRLESAKGPVEVVVIDHIEKPTVN